MLQRTQQKNSKTPTSLLQRTELRIQQHPPLLRLSLPLLLLLPAQGRLAAAGPVRPPLPPLLQLFVHLSLQEVTEPCSMQMRASCAAGLPSYKGTGTQVGTHQDAPRVRQQQAGFNPPAPPPRAHLCLQLLHKLWAPDASTLLSKGQHLPRQVHACVHTLSTCAAA